MEAIGKRLARLRRDAGLSQHELARRSGVHRGTIARIESGSTDPSAESSVALSAALGVTTDELLGVPTRAIDATRAVEEFVASGEAAKMVPPASPVELQWIAANPAALAGPPVTPRSLAFFLLGMRERPGWRR